MNKGTERAVGELAEFLDIEELKLSPSSDQSVIRTFMHRIVLPLSEILGDEYNLASAMMCTIPVKFVLHNVHFKGEAPPDIVKEIQQKMKENPLFIKSACAFIHPELNTYMIEIRLFKFPEEKANDFFNRVLIQEFACIAFLYMHECMHIFNRDLCYASSYRNTCHHMWKQYMGADAVLTTELAHMLCNMAEDYHINFTLGNSNRSMHKANASMGGLYNKDYNSSTMTQMHILDEMLKKKNISTRTHTIGDWVIDEVSLTKQGVNGESTEKHIIVRKMGDMQDLEDSQISKDIVNNIVVKMRGAGSSSVFEKLGIPMKIQMDWAKRLLTITEQYYYEKTDNYDMNWARPNKVVRSPFFKLPGIQYFNNKPHIILTYDSSSSMGEEEIRKINYVISHINNMGCPVSVLIHTDVLTEVKHFVPRDAINLVEFAKTRKWTGGTSHKEVFNWIETNTKKERNKYIVIIASDMWSDIEDIKNDYKWTRTIKTIGVSTSDQELGFGVTVHTN